MERHTPKQCSKEHTFKGFSSQWEGNHISYDQDSEEKNSIPSPRSGLTFKLKKNEKDWGHIFPEGVKFEKYTCFRWQYAEGKLSSMTKEKYTEGWIAVTIRTDKKYQEPFLFLVVILRQLKT